jgi:hypothetical protein
MDTMESERVTALEGFSEPASPAVASRSATLAPAGEPGGAARARLLVDEMVRAGKWPQPQLLFEIAATGEAALEPLLEIIGCPPRGPHIKGPLWHALSLLGEIGSTRAVPGLVQVIRIHKNEFAHHAAHQLAKLAQPGFDALIELCRDPAITGEHRLRVICGAKSGAAVDLSRRAQLAEVVGTMLEELVATAKEKRARGEPLWDDPEDEESDEEQEFLESSGSNDVRSDDGTPADSDADAPREFDRRRLDLDDELEASGDPGSNTLLSVQEILAEIRDEFEFEADAKFDKLSLTQQISCLIEDLSDLADPSTRELIDMAFREDLCDCDIIDLDRVNESYARGGSISADHVDDLVVYERLYREHVALAARKIRRRETMFDRVPQVTDLAEGTAATPRVSVTGPIRNEGHNLGRNDPCWCGSGKKYKKCHWGKDRAE